MGRICVRVRAERTHCSQPWGKGQGADAHLWGMVRGVLGDVYLPMRLGKGAQTKHRPSHEVTVFPWLKAMEPQGRPHPSRSQLTAPSEVSRARRYNMD